MATEFEGKQAKKKKRKENEQVEMGGKVYYRWKNNTLTFYAYYIYRERLKYSQSRNLKKAKAHNHTVSDIYAGAASSQCEQTPKQANT